MRKNIIFLLTALLAATLLLPAIAPMTARAQELDANVSVIATRVPSTVDHKIFQTLQNSIHDFLNNRRWSNEAFQNNEKILCNFLINVTAAGDNNTFTASLTVQAGRPIYNSSYQSPLINYNDESFTFRYVEFQPLDFNENRVQGSEPFAANLTAQLAYYVYIILGLDFDSYALRGGDPYYQRALNIVDNAPDNSQISGWKAFDGVRNRYWLIENLTNSKYTLVHDAFYNYYRQGLDQMYDKDADARAAVLNALNMLNTINTDNPNTMIMQFFFQGKSSEMAKIFQRSAPDEKNRALELLTRLDISNINNYKQALQ